MLKACRTCLHRRTVTLLAASPRKPSDVPKLPNVQQRLRNLPASFDEAVKRFRIRPEITPALPHKPRSAQEREAVENWQPVVRERVPEELRIAIVGRMNVGKSSLWNALTDDRKRKKQLVRDVEGITRDAVEADAQLQDMYFRLVDTPGVIDGSVVEEAAHTVETADAAIFVTSVENGAPTQEERDLAQYLEHLRIPVAHVVNKADLVTADTEDEDALEAHIRRYAPLGLGQPTLLSCRQRTGFEDLYSALSPLHHFNYMSRVESDWVLEDAALAGDDAALEEVRLRNSTEDEIRVVVIGRPNSGKSSLFNRLLGYERVRVSDEQHTTRDAVEASASFRGRKVRLIDTAGMTRKRYHREHEFVQALQESTLRAIKYAHVCVIVFDAMEGQPSKMDMAIGHMCAKEGRAFVFCANKWDGVLDTYATAEAIDFKMKRQLHEIAQGLAVVGSAKTGLNLTLLLDQVLEVYDTWNKRVPSSTLTRFWRRLEKSVNFPSHVSRVSRVKQVNVRPPTFLLQLQTRDEEKKLKTQYELLVRNALVEEFHFRSVPVRVLQEVRSSHPDWM